MGKYFITLPSMGESVVEATITNWLKEVGDKIDVDEPIVEIATDKVDSDITSEYKGILLEKKFDKDDVIKVGDIIAIIESSEFQDGNIKEKDDAVEFELSKNKDFNSEIKNDIAKLNHTDSKLESDVIESQIEEIIESISDIEDSNSNPNQQIGTNKFLSPLVKSIAQAEGINDEELEKIPGTGVSNRITKKDIFDHISKKKKLGNAESVKANKSDQIIELSRLAKITADHMINSKKTSAHVNSFIEADITNLSDWRDKYKVKFMEEENEKLTYTPIFIQAVISALKEFPLLNSSFDGDKIIQKKDINIGMATALENGDLIVPVIKNADHFNLIGLAKSVNDLSIRARNKKLNSDEIKGGTFTVTNIGNFQTLTGTPIINQPQIGIIAFGVIRKMPSVIETSNGDFIGIRKKIIISHSYDHRVINGAMGGNFLRSVAKFIEQWDLNFEI